MKNLQEQILDLSSEERSKLTDGYHSFTELYEFRKIYNAALFNKFEQDSYDSYDVHKSWRHNDGELCFGGDWFIVSAKLPSGLISNHYHKSDWDLFKIPIYEKALFKYDNHTSQDVLFRLKNLINE